MTHNVSQSAWTEVSKRVARWAALAMSVLVTGIVTADSVADLAEGAVGLKWGASAPEILAAYPTAQQLPQRGMAIVSPTGFLGARSALGDIFILTMDAQTGFSAVDFQVSADDVYGLIDSLESGLGEERFAALRTMFGTFQHVHEWSTPQLGVRVSYTTSDGKSGSPPAGMGTVQAQRGPLTTSLIDEMQKPMPSR